MLTEREIDADQICKDATEFVNGAVDDLTVQVKNRLKAETGKSLKQALKNSELVDQTVTVVLDTSYYVGNLFAAKLVCIGSDYSGQEFFDFGGGEAINQGKGYCTIDYCRVAYSALRQEIISKLA